MENKPSTMEGLVVSQMSFKNKRILITGHTGFKGAWLTHWLHHLGASVFGVSLEPDTKPNLFSILDLESRVEQDLFDIRDQERIQNSMSRFSPEIVIHLAAQTIVKEGYRDPIGTWSTNVTGTINVLESIRTCRSVKACLIVTSDKCYCNAGSKDPLTESSPLGGLDPYSASKSACEIATSSYRHSFFTEADCAIATARAGNVIGGGDWSPHRLLPDIIRSVSSDAPLQLRNPTATRPWQHVIPCLHGYLLIVHHLLSSNGKNYARAWNLGPPPEDLLSVEQITRLVGAYFHDTSAHIAVTKDTISESEHILLDSNTARKDLKWNNHWSIAQAIDRTVSWYKAWLHGSDMATVTTKQIEEYSVGIKTPPGQLEIR